MSFKAKGASMELVRKVVKNPEKTEGTLIRSAEAYAIVKKVSVEREYVAQCLVDLDAYSSQTFEHSVNAAAIFCQEMIRSGRYHHCAPICPPMIPLPAMVAMVFGTRKAVPSTVR